MVVQVSLGAEGKFDDLAIGEAFVFKCNTTLHTPILCNKVSDKEFLNRLDMKIYTVNEQLSKNTVCFETKWNGTASND